MANLRVGIIGLGRLGSRHARHLAFEVRGEDLVAACALDDEQLAWARNELGVPHTYKDYKEMIEKENLDAIFIVAPTPLHPEMTIYCLNKGLHVFCEKPMSTKLEDLPAMVKCIKEHPNQLYQMGFMRRYDESYVYAKKMIDEGKLGHILYMRGYGVDPISGMKSFIKFASAADSGGPFVDMDIHDIDLIRWFTGSEPVQAYGLVSNIAAPELNKIGDYETGVAQLKLANGTIATILGGRSAAHGNQVELEVMGDKGWIRVGEHPDLNRVTVFDSEGVVRPSLQSFGERFNTAFLAEVQDFIDNVKNGTKPRSSLEDGVRDLTVAKACQQSADEGKLIDIKY
jgi:myo-inositol 2-dehydrogenase/D-chiro-inositol 1-dehydrogenase